MRNLRTRIEQLEQSNSREIRGLFVAVIDVDKTVKVTGRELEFKFRTVEEFKEWQTENTELLHQPTGLPGLLTVEVVNSPSQERIAS